MPHNPAAWLYRVARNQSIDTLRLDGRTAPWPDEEPGAEATFELPPQLAAEGRFAGELDDEELALPFTACHPAVPVASQVALALRVLAGLDHATLAAHPVAAHPDAHALAATLLLHGALLTGQHHAAGHIVLLPGQPLDRWDAGMVRMGLRHLQRALAAQRLSRWHLLAVIAAEHATAADYAGTDWPTMVGYYGLLLKVDPSAAPRLAHAAAMALLLQAQALAPHGAEARALGQRALEV